MSKYRMFLLFFLCLASIYVFQLLSPVLLSKHFSSVYMSGNVFQKIEPTNSVDNVLQKIEPTKSADNVLQIEQTKNAIITHLRLIPKDVIPTVSSISKIINRTSLPRDSRGRSGIKKITWLNIPKWLNNLVWNQIKLSTCEVNSCKIEPGRENADIVIIYMVGFRQKASVHRPPGQVWVLFGHESPANSYSEMWKEPEWKDQINWTMTYRLDSSFPLPYGYVVHRPVSERPNLKEVLSKKKKLVAWVVSNCEYVHSGREEYVDLLNTHLPRPVDVYGGCGNKTTHEDVFQKIDREYKFYLGFENSLCKDYISEKFHIRQNMNLIVIVRGSGNYSYFYPRNTFIDTRDFNSTKELSDYILYLDKNNTAYLEYLQNKAPYKLGGEETIHNHLCEMCKRIHQPMEPSYYIDVGAWWYNNTCSKPTDLV